MPHKSFIRNAFYRVVAISLAIVLSSAFINNPTGWAQIIGPLTQPNPPGG